MLRNTLLTFLILIMGKAYAQEDYFVLIQSDNNQPFYVRLEDKTLSSTSKGHLILSQLKGGNHSIVIGWPRQIFPEQQYTFGISGKDLELQLKDQGDRGWGLFNPQTQELVDAGKQETTTAVRIEGVKKDDAFSRLMAGVVSDTAVMYNTYSVEATLKDSPVVATVEKADTPRMVVADAGSRPMDTAVVKVDSPAVIAAVTVPPHDSVRVEPAVPKVDSSAAVTIPRSKGTVVKLSERKTPKGLRLAFADRPGGRKADTVIVIIPMDSSLAVQKPVATPPSTDSAGAHQVAETGQKRPDSIQSVQPVEAPPTTPEKVATNTDKEYKSDTLHLYIGPKKGGHTTIDSSRTHPPLAAHTGADTSGARTHTPAVTRSFNSGELYRKPDTSQKKETVAPAAKPMLVNSDCHNFASDYDVDKLRVKMLEISKDDDKIAIAKKIFKTKCFTTKQIKALSEVFTGDAARYRFFEAAYPFVSDDRFRDLSDLLADPVYNGKFRAMTGQR